MLLVCFSLTYGGEKNIRKKIKNKRGTKIFRYGHSCTSLFSNFKLYIHFLTSTVGHGMICFIAWTAVSTEKPTDGRFVFSKLNNELSNDIDRKLAEIKNSLFRLVINMY